MIYVYRKGQLWMKGKYGGVWIEWNDDETEYRKHANGKVGNWKPRERLVKAAK